MAMSTNIQYEICETAGLLTMPFSGPKMWDLTQSYQIQKLSQKSFKCVMFHPFHWQLWNSSILEIV